MKNIKRILKMWLDALSSLNDYQTEWMFNDLTNNF